MKKILFIVFACVAFSLNTSAQSITADMRSDLKVWLKYAGNFEQATVFSIMSQATDCENWSRGQYMQIIDNIDEYPTYAEIIIMGFYIINDGDEDETYLWLRDIFEEFGEVDNEKITIANNVWRKKYKSRFEEVKRKKIAEAKAAEKKRIAAEQEAERKRIAEEKERERIAERRRIAAEKERQAEIERRKQERRKKIDSYLAGEDKNKVYNMPDDMQSAYYAMMKSAVTEAVSQYAPDNIDILVADSVIVNANGNTYHNIKVNFKSGTSSAEIENAIDAAVSSLNLYVMKLPIPDTDTTYSVNSRWKFIVPYKIETEQQSLIVIKKRRELVLKKGEEEFYNSNKSAIADSLKSKGKYSLNVWRQEIDGKVATEVETLDYFKPVGSVMFGYSFSPAAPLGFMFALNNVYSKHWGAYLSLRTSVKGKETVNSGAYVTQWTPKGYTCFNFNVGATYSITKYGFIYAGIGYGQCGRYYEGEYVYNHGTDGSSGSAKIKTPKNTGFGMEFGIIVRPLKWIGASAGYNFIPGRHYGECNFGVLFFFN